MIDAILKTLTGGVGAAVEEVIDRLVPDKNAAAEAKRAMNAKLQEAELELRRGQMQINAEDAKSGNLMQAGWRPFTGWGSAFCLFYAVMIKDLILMVCYIAGVPPDIIALIPDPDTGETTAILYAMLGFGTFRSFEKWKGKA